VPRSTAASAEPEMVLDVVCRRREKIAGSISRFCIVGPISLNGFKGT
jgi:hypothetical protein